MAFRDDVHALRTRVSALEAELSQSERHRADLEAEIADLRHTIVRLRSGVRDEEALRKDPHLAASEALLPLAGILGVLVTILVATAIAPYQFHGHLQLDAFGIRNFLHQLSLGGLKTLWLITVTLPLAVLPSVASIGLHMRRKFGWYAAVFAWSLWALVCPPLGLYGLYALGRRSIRDLLLVDPMPAPVPRARVEVDRTEPLRVQPAEVPVAARAPERRRSA